ncbi:serine hydrolase domain-containing protein [uncultured Roseobacter sp.]|uniref:serine hydrolase domain-containing protein n=1 Tax=uncultured Roseobacter sp. TaxID=114847 RepID=UPI002610C2A6|nr:serine hydrolase domain-containing protein [uncultured Roseobacter sp.]
MNRRTFTATSLAAVLAPLPRPSFAQQTTTDLPGYQVAEINGGRLTAGHGGMATPHAVVDDDTLFQVASCSKTVTALAVLTLVRDGRIELDQAANRYLRQWQLPGPRGATATIAELLSHTAGTTVHGFEGYGPGIEIPNLPDILSGRHPANSNPVRTRRRLFRQFRYSGGGTMVLQALIEDITEMGFATYTTTEVLTPIGTPRATFALKPEPAFAHGFYADGQPLVGGFRRHPESAAAGLWATASDLAKVLQAVLHSLSGARDALIPAALAQRMVTPVSWRSGLGVFVTPSATILHEGRNFGFDSVMAAELATGRVRAAVTNRNGALETYARQLVPD